MARVLDSLSDPEQTLNISHQRIEPDGLCKSKISPGLYGIRQVGFTKSSENKNRDSTQCQVQAQQSYHLDTIEIWHIEVGDNEVRALRLGHVETLTTICASDDAESLILEHHHHQVAAVGVVLNNKYFPGHGKSVLSLIHIASTCSH